jgi:cell division protein FtsQ
MSRAKKIRGKNRFIIYFVLVTIATYFIAITLNSAIKSNSMFSIKRIQITGNQFLSNEHLVSISDSLIGTNLFQIDKKDIKLRYQALSRIKDVDVTRLPPSRLKIKVTERKGLFYIKDTTGEYHPIDSEFYVLDKADWYINEDIPFINIAIPVAQVKVGEKIEDHRIRHVFAVYDVMKKNHPAILNEISEFYFKNNDLYFVDIKSGCRVMVNADNINTQLSRFIFLRDNQGFPRNSTIDIRFDTHVITI